MINAQLRQKYDNKFNFFFAKSISEIAYNQTCARSTLAFKDVIVFSECSEYLKRSYLTRNAAGKNEIQDRIKLLAHFYDKATMLTYEYPMMVLSNTKDIFMKRVKRMKKMIASDCSSQQSSEHSNSRSSEAKSFSSSIFLRTIHTNQIQSLEAEDSIIKNCHRSQKSFDSDIHDVYGDRLTDILASQPYYEQNPKNRLKFKKNQNESNLFHLIIDIDDVDVEKVNLHYRKIHQNQIANAKIKKQLPMKKSSIVITALDFNPYGDKQSESSGKNPNYYPKDTKNKKKPVSYMNRYKNQQVYDETIPLKISSNARQVPQRLPSFGSAGFFGGDTERNHIFGQQSQVPSYYPQRYQDNKKLIGESRQVYRERGWEQMREPVRQKVYSHNYQHFSQMSSTIENETVYMTQENSVSHLSNKIHKKQYVREKAVALLHKVKSEEKLPIFVEEFPRRIPKYPSRH